MIEIDVNSVCVKRIDNQIVTAGCVGDTLKATFGDGWDGLKKTAVFTVPGIEKPIKRDLVDNQCEMPVEAVAYVGTILVGVYGEEHKDGRVTLRHSPVPVTVTVRQGSYDANAVESEYVTINEWFAKQAADAKKAADAAIRAAKIANKIMQKLEGGKVDG